MRCSLNVVSMGTGAKRLRAGAGCVIVLSAVECWETADRRAREREGFVTGRGAVRVTMAAVVHSGLVRQRGVD